AGTFAGSHGANFFFRDDENRILVGNVKDLKRPAESGEKIIFTAGSPPVAVIPLGSDPGFSTATPISESLQWRSHLLYIPMCRNNYGDIMCAVKVQTLTPTEAAVVACVPVRDVNRIIDEKILPEAFYVADRDRARRFYADACAFISFYFRAANRLTSEERMRTIAVASARLREESGSVLEKEWIIREEFLTIDLAPFMRNVHERLARLAAAQALVVEDADIMGGTPVIRDTHI